MAAGEILLDTDYTLHLQRNDRMNRGEGGAVVLVADATMLPDELVEEGKVTNVTLVINYRRDRPMERYPDDARTAPERYQLVLRLKPKP